MPLICEPNTLAEAASCYCLPERVQDSILIYLLAQIAGGETDPAALARLAKCYCFDKRTSEAVKTYLLCQIAGNTAAA